MNLDINRKTLPIGSVAYFVDKCKYKTPGRTWGVDYGIVEEYYATEICLKLIEPKDIRLIDGIPISEYPIGEYHKLPKGWTYDTKLFEISYESPPLPSISDPRAILSAYESGVLVNVQDNLHADIKVDIDKQRGWRILLKTPMWKPAPRPYISLPFHEVFQTYDEAKAIVDVEYADFDWQASLSDYDWSVEQIDRTLCCWAQIYQVDSETVQAIRNRLLSFDNIEELEVRFCCTGNIEWKYARNKRWSMLKRDYDV